MRIDNGQLFSASIENGAFVSGSLVGENGVVIVEGQVSASGDVIGLSGSFSDLSVSNLAAVGDTSTDTINITGNTTFNITEGANSIKIFEAALGDNVLKFEATEEPELLFAFDPTNMGNDDGSQGRIGLGVPTSSIQSKLHVKHVTGSGAPASVLKLDATGKDNLLFVSSSGNIGVGTGTPGKELEVIGHVSASGDVTANTGSFAGGLVLTSPNGTEYRFTVDNNGFLSITGSAA